METQQYTIEELLSNAVALSHKETDLICLLSNLSALIKATLCDTNWVGFYQLKQDELVLGPFQGLPACTRIPLNKGVCGQAASTLCSMRIDNVHLFPGHIACDSASNSELVLCIIVNKTCWGVLDCDSASFNRFSPTDQEILEQLCLWLGIFIEQLSQ